MFKTLKTLHSNVNRVGKEIILHEYDLQAGQVPVEIVVDWEGGWLQGTYGKVFAGETLTYHTALFQNGRNTTIYAQRGGCTTVAYNKIYFQHITRPNFETRFAIQSATPVIPEPNTFQGVLTLSCPGEDETQGARPAFYISSPARITYVAEVFDDITMQFIQVLISRLFPAGYVGLDGLINGVAVVCDAAPDFREGTIFGLEVTKATYPYTIHSEMTESMYALDIYNGADTLEISNTEKIRYIKTRATDQTIAQKIADIITQNAQLRGTVVLNPSDTYYSIIETAAHDALWNIEHV